MKYQKTKYLILVLVTLLTGNVFGQADERMQLYKTLKGEISRKDYRSYIQIPFDLPEGVKRLTVEFSYNTKEEHTTIDLGLMDTQQRFRGWSGGVRNKFTISEQDATPGYLPGPISSGGWILLLGIPNIRDGITANYETKIFIEKEAGITDFSDKPIRTEAGWYRGDLHIHSGNSDGKCISQSGNQVPCPVYRVIDAAVKKNLDFIALTDHNTIAQSQQLRELQPAFDKILFVPGQEISTFYGHANVFGLIDFIDFRMISPSYTHAKKWMDTVLRTGGIISINHPGIPSGESCMGCGWQIDSIPDNVITAVEVVNGGSLRSGAEESIQGWDLWHKMLKTGQRVTAIGGSDDHHAQEKDVEGAIGNPTTIIYMNELSVKGVLDGLRSGRVFVDIDGDKDHFLDFSAGNKKNEVHMGSTLNIMPFDNIDLSVDICGVPNGQIEFIIDGKVAPALIRKISQHKEKIVVQWKANDRNHFIYVKVRDNKGKLVLFCNPVYIV